MNSFHRAIIGLLSSLLAALGLWRAAERLDPLSHRLAPPTALALAFERAADNCTLPCNYRVENVAPLLPAPTDPAA